MRDEALVGYDANELMAPVYVGCYGGKTCVEICYGKTCILRADWIAAYREVVWNVVKYG